MSKLPRNTTIEFMRLIAAFGVVTLHVRFSTRPAEILNLIFSPLCVPFFYLTSLTYFTSGLKSVTIQDHLNKIFKRILIPYLTWTTIYMSLFFVKGLITNNPREFSLWKVIFYGNSSVQLYFIPALLGMQSFVLAIYLFLKADKESVKWGILFFVGALLFFVIGDYNNCYGTSATGQYIGIVLFIASGFYLSTYVESLGKTKWLIIIGTALTLTAVGLKISNHPLEILEYPLIYPMGGIGVVMFSFGYPKLSIAPWIQKISSTSFGIYLSHVLFLESFEFILDKYFGSIAYTLLVKIGFVTLIFLSSIILVSIIRKIPILKVLMLGESK